MYKYIKPSVWALNDYKALPKYLYYISSIITKAICLIIYVVSWLSTCAVF